MIQDLHFLVHALTQSEKRYFKLHSSLGFEGDKNYLKLFEILLRMDVYDEAEAKKRSGFAHFPQQKKHLYIKILESLRNFHQGKNITSLIDSCIAEYRILLDKSMLKAAAKTLKKAEILAVSHESFADIIRIKQFEIDIFVAEGNPLKIEEHIREIRELMPAMIQLLDNKLAIEKEYLFFVKLNQQTEFIRSGEELISLNSSLDRKLLKPNAEEAEVLPLGSQLIRYYINGLYHFLCGELETSLKYFELQQLTYENHPHFAKEQALEFARSLANTLLLSIKTKNYVQTRVFYHKLTQLKENSFVTREQINFWLYLLQLSTFVNQEKFREAYDWMTQQENAEKPKELLKDISSRALNNEKSYLLFDASLTYMMLGELKKAQRLISTYLNTSRNALKTDAYTLVRIIQLFVFLEREEFSLLENELRSLKRFLSENKRMFAFEKSCIAFLEEICTLITTKEKTLAWKKFHEELEVLKQDRFEKNVFFSFDLSVWVTWKIQH